MLLPRVITAVVLLALLLPSLLAATPWPFALLTLLLIAAAGWEWSRLNGVATLAALGPGALLALAGLWAVYTGSVANVPSAVWWAAAAAWFAMGSLALRSGPTGWLRWPAVLRLALGMLALWVAWLALAQARSVGVNFVLSAMCLVWAADIGAYAAGRAFGRHKLAPTISPGKSWEGVVGGMLSVLVLAALWVLLIDRRWPVDSASLYTQLVERFGWPGLPPPSETAGSQPAAEQLFIHSFNNLSFLSLFFVFLFYLSLLLDLIVFHCFHVIDEERPCP